MDPYPSSLMAIVRIPVDFREEKKTKTTLHKKGRLKVLTAVKLQYIYLRLSNEAKIEN
jgi:hypothetical protein